MKKILLYLVFSMFSVGYATESDSLVLNERVVFSDAMKLNFKKYVNLSNKAYTKKNYEQAQSLFDSLVDNTLIGTQFDNFSFKRFGKRRIELAEIKKPIMLVTYSSWCVMGKGEIPALNQLAKDYDDKVQIVVVFWNKKSEAKHLAKKFDSDIMVCYANEENQDDNQIITTLKRTFGFPTMYFINEQKQLVNLKRSFLKPENKVAVKQSTDQFYDKFSEELSSVVIIDKNKKSFLATN